MPLIEATDLRTLFDIATQIVDDRLTFCIRNASRTLVSWVGQDAYDDAEDATPDDQPRADLLKDAESYLSMYHALLNTAAHIRRNGLVSREMDQAGPMGGGNVQNQYYSPDEVAALRAEYFSQAETLAAPYITNDEKAVALGAGTITMKGGVAAGFE